MFNKFIRKEQKKSIRNRFDKNPSLIRNHSVIIWSEK